MAKDDIPEESGVSHSSISFRIASIVILTSVTALFTYAIRVPIAPTRGYLNLGDVAIYFSALTFGPWIAAIAGGLGTAVADLMAGYVQYSPITLFAHGLQGLLAGFVLRRVATGENWFRGVRFYLALAGAFLLGTIAMAGIYFAAQVAMVGVGAALVELPGNILQNIAGIVGGTLLAGGVKRAYPPVTRFRW